jgi:ATP-dependent helicase/nuclease subunit A
MNFKIYRSSAGSGKTFTLAKEYLKIALVAPSLEKFEPSYYKHILAVTFTNDAASEMKERIMDYLSGFAKQNPDEGMKVVLLSEIQTDFPQLEFNEKKLFARAKLAHEHLLHNYSDFSVSTIDSFNNRVVQSFKKDLELPYNYEIELDTADLREEASDKLQNRIREGKENSLNDLLLEFAFNKADEGKNWYIDDDLEGFARNLFDEEKQGVVSQLAQLTPKDFKKAKNDLFDYLRKVEEEVKALGKQAMNLMSQHQVDLDSFAYGVRSGIGTYFNKVSQLKEPLHKLEPNSYAWAAVEKNKWVKAKIDATQKSAIEFISGDLAGIFEAIEAVKERELASYIIAYSLRNNIYLLATITELNKHLQEIKEERSLVHISEFNRKINEIVEEEPVPYIYERMGERYMHILIDEFQDTSQMQWHNLIPLVANSLGLNMQNLVVGDAKQAVYRWRGGKSEMLVKLPQVPTASPDSMVAEQAMIFPSQVNINVLETNYRSRANIIRFNNIFFENCRDWFKPLYPELEEYYGEVAQNPNKKDGGHVQIDFMEKQEKHLSTKETYALFTFSRILEIIAEAEKQDYSKSDIAILTRTNTQGAFLAEKLLEKKIPVVSSDSLLVGSSPTVRFMVGIFKILHQPLDPMSKMNLAIFVQNHFNQLQQEGFDFGEDVENSFSNYQKLKIQRALNKDDEQAEEVEELSSETNEIDKVSVLESNETSSNGNRNFAIQASKLQKLEEVVKEDSLQPFNDFLCEHFDVCIDLEQLLRITLYEKAEELIRVFNLQQDRKQQVYVHKFLDFILNFTNRFGNDLEEFLNYWERKEGNLSVSMPKSSQAVRIMTTHKSKGLQFPIVIVPFADWETKPKAGSTLWQKWKGNSIVPALPSVILSINKDLERTEFAEVYQQELQATFLDSFNLLYVAFTRPESKLFVLTKYDKPKDGEIKAISHLLDFYLQKSEINVTDFATQEVEMENGSLEQFGYKKYILQEDFIKKGKHDDEKKKVEKKKHEFQPYLMNQFLHTDLRGKIETRRASISELEEKMEISDLQDPRQQGILVHYAFEQVKYKEDIPKAVQALASEGKIGAEQIESLIEQMENVVSIPEISRYFTKQKGIRVENEREILIGFQNNQLRTARPDRLVFDGEEVVIMDYKTGKEDDKYQNQLKDYGFFFRKMGYKKIKMLIVYTEEGNVVEVD